MNDELRRLIGAGIGLLAGGIFGYMMHPFAAFCFAPFGLLGGLAFTWD